MNELVTMLKGLPTWSYIAAGLLLFYLLMFIFYSRYAKNEGLRLAYAVTAGTHTVEASATTSRPGVLHKTVNETFGPVKLEVEVEPRKKYALGFNTKEKEFTFTELPQ